MIKKKIKLTNFHTFVNLITSFFNKFDPKNIKNSKHSHLFLSLITFIIILFLYLVYLSIPSFYKNEVHDNLLNRLQNSFNQNLSLPKNIKYSIIPSPHFIYSDIKFLNDKNDKIISFAEIKELKIYISQKNLFNQSKIKVKYITIDKGNFYFDRENIKKLDFIFNSKISSDIIINNSNLFFKNKNKELVTLINSKNIKLKYDNKKKKNFVSLNGNIFNTPIKIESNVDYISKTNETNILLKDLKLKIKNLSDYKKKYSSYNEIKIFRTELNNNLKIDDDKLLINSSFSNFQLIPVDYQIDIDLDPFYFNSKIYLEKMNISQINSPIIFEDLIKNFVLGNNVINGKINFKIDEVKNNKIIENLNINLKFNSGEIFFKDANFKVKKIGNLSILSNSFELDDDRLILNGIFNLEIKNEKNFYRKFMVSKKNRFSLTKIKFEFVYNFATNKFYINKIIFNDDLKNIIDLQYEEVSNWAKFKKLIQNSTEYYSG